MDGKLFLVPAAALAALLCDWPPFPRLKVETFGFRLAGGDQFGWSVRVRPSLGTEAPQLSSTKWKRVFVAHRERNSVLRFGSGAKKVMRKVGR